MKKSPIIFIGLTSLLVSCSSPDAKVIHEYSPLHGGVLLKGKSHYLEIVNTGKTVDIYPLEASGDTLQPVPLDKLKISALYSPDRSKANWEIDLHQKGDHFTGIIDDLEEQEYQIYVDFKHGKKKEKFVHELPSHDKAKL